MTDFLWVIGPYLLPLLGLSVYSVGLILQKNRDLKACGALQPEEFERLLESVARVEWVGHGLSSTHPLARILESAGDSISMRQAKAQADLAKLEDRLGYFPALANVATLGGLFGTVCGMIGAFLSLRSGGGADPASLAGGLGQALLATAVGLVTAIPSLIAHAVFQKRVRAIAGQMESLLSALIPAEGSRPLA